MLLAGVVAITLQPPLVRSVRDTLFDGYQALSPRARKSFPAIIVAIDEQSLAAYGQWPWPRTRTAELLRRIAESGPAAIGVDVLFSEPDGSSASGAGDAALARAIRGNKVVLAVAGLPYRDRRFMLPPKVAPIRLLATQPPPLLSFKGQLQSLPALDRAAAGRGLVSVGETEGIIRRIPVIAKIGEVYVPSLAAEMFRVAKGIGSLRIEANGHDQLVLHLGDVAVPTQGDGRLWLRFGHHDPARFVSAAKLLGGRVAPQVLHDKLVLVGVTGLGLLDQKMTPLGERVPGVEIHQQILEQMFDGEYLRRPFGARLAPVWCPFGARLVTAWRRLDRRPTVDSWGYRD